VHMHHGKKREIRQLFLALGHPVKRLKRYQIGAFPLRGIPLRAGKQLSPSQIESLFEQPGLAPRQPGVRPAPRAAAKKNQPQPPPGKPLAKRPAKTNPARRA